MPNSFMHPEGRKKLVQLREVHGGLDGRVDHLPYSILHARAAWKST